MEQARVQEETQMRMDHARRLKQMRQSLEDEKRKRGEESARLRRQLELKQVHSISSLPSLVMGLSLSAHWPWRFLKLVIC